MILEKRTVDGGRDLISTGTTAVNPLIHCRRGQEWLTQNMAGRRIRGLACARLRRTDRHLPYRMGPQDSTMEREGNQAAAKLGAWLLRIFCHFLVLDSMAPLCTMIPLFLPLHFPPWSDCGNCRDYYKKETLIFWRKYRYNNY